MCSTFNIRETATLKINILFRLVINYQFIILILLWKTVFISVFQILSCYATAIGLVKVYLLGLCLFILLSIPGITTYYNFLKSIATLNIFFYSCKKLVFVNTNPTKDTKKNSLKITNFLYWICQFLRCHLIFLIRCT